MGNDDDDALLADTYTHTHTGAGINDNKTTPRTPWPLTGGSLNVTLHDAAAYIWVNLGLGVNTTNFNYTIVQGPLNETGAGDLCFPHIPLPEGMPIEDGTPATIQFATAGTDGEGLYNVSCCSRTCDHNLLLTDRFLVRRHHLQQERDPPAQGPVPEQLHHRGPSHEQRPWHVNGLQHHHSCSILHYYHRWRGDARAPSGPFPRLNWLCARRVSGALARV